MLVVSCVTLYAGGHEGWTLFAGYVGSGRDDLPSAVLLRNFGRVPRIPS